jgi:hypothetical protein
MSSALVHQRCRSACRERLVTCSGLPDADHRAYEGFSYSPTTGEAFVEDKLAVLRDEPVSLGAIDHGFSYIITLKFPSDEGTEDIETLAGALLDHYKVGTVLTYGGQSFLCYKAERRGSIVQEVDWQVLTVVVTLQTFTTD